MGLSHSYTNRTDVRIGRMMSAWLYYLAVALLLVTSTAGWLLTLLTLPGNWIVVAAAAVFAWLIPEQAGQGISWTTVGVLLALAVVGEVIEFVAGAAGAARQGASRRSVVLSLVGAFVGGLAGLAVGTPIPVLGSLVMAVLGGAVGAYAGAYLGEWSIGRAGSQRMAAGQGAFAGRIWGTVGKLTAGAAMLAILTFDALF
jgi:uncharacterized protein YqgC (DUF456 family)